MKLGYRSFDFFKVHISTIIDTYHFKKFYTPSFSDSSFQISFLGVFSMVLPTIATHSFRLLLFFLWLFVASRGSQFRHRSVCPCPCLKLSARSQVSDSCFYKTVISIFELKKMILGRALCGIKFLGAKLNQSHLEKTCLPSCAFYTLSF